MVENLECFYHGYTEAFEKQKALPARVLSEIAKLHILKMKQSWNYAKVPTRLGLGLKERGSIVD